MSTESIEQLIEKEVEKRVGERLCCIPLPPSDIRIVIGQRGWVWVGYWSQDGDEVTLSNARVIRRWGTSSGLAELKTGPLPETKLDAPSSVYLHKLSIIASIGVETTAWSKALGS